MKETAFPAAAVGFVLASAGAAHATIAYPAQGGTWDYGNGKVQACSNCDKAGRRSSSLYRNGNLQAGNVCVAKGWSYATKCHAPWTGGFAYCYKPSCWLLAAWRESVV